MTGSSGRRLSPAAELALLLTAGVATAAAARDSGLTLPPSTLDQALLQLGRAGAVDISSTEPGLRAVRTRAVGPSRSVAQALRTLLRDTGYRAIPVDARSFRVVRDTARAAPRAPVPHAAPPPIQQRGSDVVVTAGKQRQPLLLYPGSILVFSPPAGAPRASADDLSGLADQVPVMQSTQLGPGRNKVFIRGIADSSFNGAAQSTASIYLDDVQIGFSGPDPGLKLYDVDEIAVLEGPQGTLYGSGAIGGIVRVTTRAPNLLLPSGTLAISGTATAGGAPGGEASLVTNLPLVPGTLGVRLVGYRSRAGGYIDDVVRHRRDINAVDTGGGRGTALLSPGDGWRVELAGAYQRIAADDAQYADSRVGALAQASAIAQPYGSTVVLGRLSVGKSWDSGLQLTAATALVDTRGLERFDASEAAGQTGARAYEIHGAKLLTSHETRLSRSLGNGNSWVLGFSLVRDRDALDRTRIATDGGAASVGVTNLTRSASVFGEATRVVLPNLGLTLGARLTAARTDGDPSFNPRVSAYVKGRSTVRVDPTAALSWRFAPDWALFGRYQSGFRTGGLAVAPGVGRVADFRSDTINVEEIGVRKLRRGATGLTMSAGVSVARWTAIQVDLVNRRGQSYTANIGDAHLQTLEAAVDWAPLPALHATASLAATHNRVSGTIAQLTAADNRRLPETPGFAAHAGLAYEWNVHAAPALRVGAAADYTGPSVLGVGDLLDVRQGSFGSGEVSAGARWPRFDLSLRIDNVADARANRFSYGNPFLLASGRQTTPLRPINATLSASYSW